MGVTASVCPTTIESRPGEAPTISGTISRVITVRCNRTDDPARRTCDVEPCKTRSKQRTLDSFAIKNNGIPFLCSAGNEKKGTKIILISFHHGIRVNRGSIFHTRVRRHQCAKKTQEKSSSKTFGIFRSYFACCGALQRTRTYDLSIIPQLTLNVRRSFDIIPTGTIEIVTVPPLVPILYTWVRFRRRAET